MSWEGSTPQQSPPGFEGTGPWPASLCCLVWPSDTSVPQQIGGERSPAAARSPSPSQPPHAAQSPDTSLPVSVSAAPPTRASDAWRGRTGASHARGWGHFCGITLWARGRGWAHSTRGGHPKPARGKFPRSCRRSALIPAHHKSRTLAAYVLLGRYFTDFLLCFKNKFCSRDGYFSPSNRGGSPAGRLTATPPARAAEPRLPKSLRAEIRNAGLQLRLVPHDDHPAPSWVFLTSRQALSTHGDPGRPMNSPMLYSHWRTAITFFH